MDATLECQTVFPSFRRGRVDELALQVQRILRRARIAVIYAGDKASPGAVINSSTNSRSWKSYREVAQDIADGLHRLGCRDVFLLPEDMNLPQQLLDTAAHMAWLNTGGVQGMSSIAHAPSMLEMLGIPYVGHGPLASAMLDNKAVFKRECVASGIPTPPFTVWSPAACAADPAHDNAFQKAFSNWNGSFIVKPVSGRASLHVYHVRTAEDVQQAAQHVFWATKGQVLIEGYVGGAEYCVAVAGPLTASRGILKRLSGPFVFSGLKRLLEPGEAIFTSMDQKPITEGRATPVDDNDPVIEPLMRLAQDVFENLHLEALIRLDVRADAFGRLFVLEANPKPDLRAPTADGTSLIAMGLARAQMSYDDLLLSLLADRIDSLFAYARGSEDRLRRLVGRLP